MAAPSPRSKRLLCEPPWLRRAAAPLRLPPRELGRPEVASVDLEDAILHEARRERLGVLAEQVVEMREENSGKLLQTCTTRRPNRASKRGT